MKKQIYTKFIVGLIFFSVSGFAIAGPDKCADASTASGSKGIYGENCASRCVGISLDGSDALCDQNYGKTCQTAEAGGTAGVTGLETAYCRELAANDWYYTGHYDSTTDVNYTFVKAYADKCQTQTTATFSTYCTYLCGLSPISSRSSTYTYCSSSNSSQEGISQVPLFLGTSDEPNLIFSYDDSSTMLREVMEGDYNESNYVFPPYSGASALLTDKTVAVFDADNMYSIQYRSRDFNDLFYNPSETYTPWQDESGAHHEGTTYGNYIVFDPKGNVRPNDYDTAGVDIWCAPYDPSDLSKGCLELNRVQFDDNSSTNTRWVTLINDNPTEVLVDKYYYPAVYYVFDDTLYYTQGIARICNPAVTDAVQSYECYKEYVIAPDGANFGDTSNFIYDALAPTNGLGVSGELRASNTSSAITSSYSFPSGLSYDSEMQNFANWFTYYRSRALAAKAKIGLAFKTANPEARVGFANVHETTSTKVHGYYPASGNTHISMGVADFTSSASTFYDELYGTLNGGNPDSDSHNSLLVDIGGYFDGIYNSSGPWSYVPGTAGTSAVGDNVSSGASYCRRSYHLGMASEEVEDNSNFTTNALSYYSNGVEGTGTGIVSPQLGTSFVTASADAKQSKIDANYDSDYDDYGDNAAVYSHLTQYFITFGFGLDGCTQPNLGDDIDDYTSCSPANVADDMLNAAWATGGRYNSVNTPDELFSKIVSFLGVINNTSKSVSSVFSGASVALNSGSLFDGSTLYQALFNADQWTGKILAYNINTTNGSLIESGETVAVADMVSVLPTTRNIATYGCTTSGGCIGVPFSYISGTNDLDNYYLSTSQTETLLSAITSSSSLSASQAISWLKSDTSVTYDAGFRTINTVSGVAQMGDIVNSAPVYVGQPSGPYYAVTNYFKESATYDDFRATQDIVCSTDGCTPNRAEMIYVGANDGMLHMFKVDESTDPDRLLEVGAYVPKSVIEEGKLHELYESGYEHNYYVDSTPTVGDVYFDTDGDGDTDAWKTILVGSLGAGGKGAYALDITNTTALASSNTSTGLSSKVLWEFSAEHNSDSNLGYTFSRPNIVRLPGPCVIQGSETCDSGDEGQWGVIMGNGYGAAVDDACIYILDIHDGSLLDKMCVGVSAADLGLDTSVYSNGMSTVAPVDFNGDFIIDGVYGGDLFGNLWYFDIEYDGSGSVSYIPSTGGSASPHKVFSAGIYSSGTLTQVQPITTRPVIAKHPSLAGYMIYFGTGKYFEYSDGNTASTDVQTYYGIWHRDRSNTISGVSRSHLLEQEIWYESKRSASASDDYEYRVTSKFRYDDMPWWDDNSLPDNVCLREPSVSTPDPDDCGFLGWYMDLFNKDVVEASGARTYTYEIGGTNGPDTNGERQITDSILRNGRIIFTTTIPDPGDVVCGANDTGWLMELDYETGSRLSESPFDINNDNSFTSDYIEYDEYGDELAADVSPDIVASGRKSTVGLLPTPGILADYSNPTSGKEFKYMSGSTGQVEAITENPGSTSAGRTSWIQLFR